MDIVTPAELAEHRADAESRMTSRCVIRRDNGLAPQQSDGVQPRAWLTVHTDLPCRVSGPSRGAATSRTVSTPGGDVEVPVRTWSVKHDTTNLEDGDLIEITAGPCAGEVLVIVDASQADQRTAYRVPVIGAHRPEEW